MKELRIQVVVPVDELNSTIQALIKDTIEEYGISKEKKKSYSKKEFAKAIGKSTSFIDQERRSGKLLWKRNGGTVSIPASELEKYI